MSKIVGLQILRGFAATSVVGFHLQAAAKAELGDPGFFSAFSGGGIGVDIFFVISGFIIFYVAQSRAGLTRKAFILARFWRIFPPYWLILTLYVLAALSLAIALGDTSKVPNMQNLVVSYLLLPYPDHIIIIAWTLSLEVVFYIIFAFAFVEGSRKRLFAAMLIWILIAQASDILMVEKPLWLSLVLHGVVLEFMFGIMIAAHFLSVGEENLKFQKTALLFGGSIVVLTVIFGGFDLGPLGREITAGIPAALLVYGFLGLKHPWFKKLELWGESSYILYLFHVLYFSVVGKLIEVAFGINVYHSQLWMLALFLSVIALCCLATIKFERPYQKWYKALASAKRDVETHRKYSSND